MGASRRGRGDAAGGCTAQRLAKFCGRHLVCDLFIVTVSVVEEVGGQGSSAGELGKMMTQRLVDIEIIWVGTRFWFQELRHSMEPKPWFYACPAGTRE